MTFSLTDLEDKLWRPRTAHWFFILMVGIIAYELLSGLIQFYHMHQEVKTLPPSHLSAPPVRSRPPSMDKTLAIPIFGEYIPKALVDLDVKPSVLNLTLVGIIYAPKSSSSMAIIATPGQDPQSFSIGEVVPGGAKIKQITPDGVVLIREGELESLSLPKNELNFEPLPQPLVQGSH